MEVVTGARKASNSNLEASYRSFLTPSLVLTVEPIGDATIEKASELRAVHGLKTPDAIHIATGLISGCDVFVTRDQGWARTGATLVEPQDKQ